MRRLLASLAAVLATGAAALAGAAPAVAAPAPAPDGGATADQVVVVGVPGLVWADLDPERTPELWALARGSAVGASTARAATSTTCLLDGWATLGAGNRARWAPELPPTGPDGAPAGEGEPAEGTAAAPASAAPTQEPAAPAPPLCAAQEQEAAVGLGDPAAVLDRITADPATARFGAEPGALGQAVGCAAVVGRAATLAVAAPGVRLEVTDALPADAASTAALLTGCPLALVSLDDLVGTAGSDGTAGATGDGQPAGAGRASALTALDREVGIVRAAAGQLPGDTLVLLQGVSEVGDDVAQLHVQTATGPGVDPGWLTSASTGRERYVQLIDVAPTALQALGLPQPESMNGQPMRAGGTRPELAEVVDALDRATTRAVVHHEEVGQFFWVLVAVDALLLALAVQSVEGLRRRGGRRTAGPGRLLRPLCVAVASVPVATYLAGLVPWELAGSPLTALAGSVLLATAAVTAVALGGPWRHARLGPPLAVLAVTLATLGADVLTGSHLEFNGLLGYDPIVAGRFVGYGNLTFGLFAVSALLLTAALATRLARGLTGPARRRRLLVAVLVPGVVVVVVVGAPFLGRDFGGVLAVLPGFVLLAMLLARVRVTAVRLVAVLGAAVVAVGTVAVLDWLRPPAERTHLGRFVGQVLDGGAWTVVERKAAANVGILLSSPLAWELPVLLVAAAWLLRPGGLLRSRSGDRAPGGLPRADVAVLRAGLTAVAASLVLGALVNDSGVALPATAGALLVPLLLWLVAGPSGRGHDVDDESAAQGRVSVTSRGSTGGFP